MVTNCGDLPLTLGDLRVEGAPGFAWGWPEGQPEMRNLPPLSSVTVEVWFTNDGLAEGTVADADFLVENNTPDQPVVTVPLTVRGGGAPTCDLRLLGSPINFGFVSRGTSRSRPIDALNVGTGNCEVRNEMTTFIGIGANPFIITGHLPRLVGPGQRVPVTVEFHPLTWGPMAGTLTVNYFNPYLMQAAMATANLNGVGGDSNIEVIPGHLDFGLVTAGDCASRTERVTVYNTGLVDLCITNIQLVGANCDEFVIVNRPRGEHADGCIVVTRNRAGGRASSSTSPATSAPTSVISSSPRTPRRPGTPRAAAPATGIRGPAADGRLRPGLSGQHGRRAVRHRQLRLDERGAEQPSAATLGSFIAGAAQFAERLPARRREQRVRGRAPAGRLVKATPRIIRRSPADRGSSSQATADVGTDWRR
jgi:hypothetical protein